jgi:hypothetical protein
VRLSGKEFVAKDNMIQRIPGTDKQPLTLNDVVLHVEIPSGSYLEEDCNCHSIFMLDIICTIGINICTSFNWLPQETENVHLIMENTGGHSTSAEREEYDMILKTNFNI